ncbi:MAG: hypothetical protein QG622_1452 [Actinomycetota bacterium]|nr:hypothetical protein [Actinomycetota bacterium]
MVSPTSLPQVRALRRGPAGGVPTQRIGFEIELLAPPGLSRADLAAEIARRCGGDVHRFLHTDSEPSLVPGMDFFLHLTPGFAVVGPEGDLLCRLVDDITIREDLDPDAPPVPGWYRIISDEPRLMRLVHRHADPGAPLSTVLDPLAEVFGVETVTTEGVVKVDDADGATIAMAAPLPGERERPCEIITPPIREGHEARLEQLLGPARDLGFTVPAEAAVHLHVDAAPLRQVMTFANLVRLFSAWREHVRDALATNPRCLRLAPLPQAAVGLAGGHLPGTWDDLCRAASATGLTKYADINLTALVDPRPEQDTVEIRCLPGSIDAAAVVRQAVLVERLLDRCREPRPLPLPGPGARLAGLL